jgi:two-component system, cell cycle sensor histidine kinase and response regulator CckA
MVMSIRARLQIFMMIAGCVPLVVVFLTTHTLVGRAVMDSERDKASEIAAQLASHVAEVMDRAAGDLASLRGNPLLAGDGGEDYSVHLREMQRLVGVYEAFSDISLYSTAGYLLVSTNEDHPAFQDYTTWFKDALAGRTVISHPQRRLGADGLFLVVYLPVLTEAGEVCKVLKARLSFRRVMNLLERDNPSRRGQVVLIDQWGNLLSGPPGRELLEKFDPAVPMARWLNAPPGEYLDPAGRAFLVAGEVLGRGETKVGSSWILLVMRPMEEVQAVMRDARLTLLFAALLMIVVAIGLGLFLSHRIARPIIAAGKVVGEVARGNLDARMAPGGPAELSQFTALFNGMVEEIREHRAGMEKLVRRRTDSLRRNQAKLLRLSAHLRAAINNTNNGFLVEDRDGNIALANANFAEMTGVPRETLRGPAADLLRQLFAGRAEPAEGSPRFWETPPAPEEDVEAEIQLAGPQARILFVYSASLSNRRGARIGRVWSIQDLTAQRVLESGLRQSQKMEAVGQLAGGIAHDFNNLLTGILGNLALVDMELKGGGVKRGCESLRHAIQAGERAAELVKQLLGFSRRTRMDLKPCDANQVLNEVRGLLGPTIDPRIRIRVLTADRPWRIMADVNLLSQVVMNLAVNAIDAMPRGGQLTLRTANAWIGPEEARLHAEGASGEFLRLTVEDNGHGIPAEIQARVFEPFFSTKPQGKGTGLGLATSYGIVRQLGGWIALASEPGTGTRFDVFLPRSAAAEAQPATPPKPEPHESKLARGNHETILVVDDEEVVRRVAETLFAKLGYRVLLACDGLEALAVMEKQGSSVDLVLLDLTMPNLSGRDTFRELRARFDYVPVLICSGYLLDLDEMAAECGSRPDGFIQKPYAFDEMAAMVRRVIRSARAAA